MKKSHLFQLMSLPGTIVIALLGAAALATTASAAATDYFWTAAGSGDGGTAAGGTGTWDTASSLWRNDTATGTLVTFPTVGTTNAARFGGTAGTVTVASSTNVNANQLVFLIPGYILAGPTGSTVTLTGTLPQLSNSLGAVSVSALLAGASGLTATGNGVTTLTAANTFAGGINIIRGQNLVLDYATHPTVLNNQTVGLGNGSGGTLTIKGSSSGTTTQTLGNVNFSTGLNTVAVDSNGGSGTTLNLGTLTRTTAGALLFDLSSGGSVTADLTTGSPVNLVDGVLVAGSTSTSSLVGIVRTGANTYDFATSPSAASGAVISALEATTELVTSGGTLTTNYKVTGNKTITVNSNAGTIRVDTTTATGSTLTVNSGRTLLAAKNTILFDGTGDFNVAGPGNLTGNVALLVQQWSTGTVTFGPDVAFAGQRIDKYGTGLLVNNSANTLASLNLYGGVYRAGSSAALSTGNLAIGTGGVLELTPDTGDFIRPLGTGAGAVQFVSKGGFSAFGGDRVVALGGIGAPTPLIWNSTAQFLAPGTQLILSSTTSDSTVDFRNSIDFNGVQREINVANGSAAVDAVLSGVLSSTTFAGGGLFKSGAGTLAVTAASTYTGPTTVSAGTLSLSQATLANTSTVNVASAGTLNLTHSGTDVVGEFRINGVIQPAGIYGAIGSGAQFTTARITGTGRIQAATGSSDPYLTWIGGFPTLTGPDTEKSADPDKDGLTNLVEYALDSNPTSGAADGKSRSRIETVSGDQALVLTIPVLDGAVFDNSPGPAADATVGNITYIIEGSNDLVNFTQGATKIASSTGGLTTPNAGWTQQTFRLDGDIGGLTPRGPKGFLRVRIISTP